MIRSLVMKRAAALTAALALAATAAFASDAVIGAATTFTSPNGVVERCVRIAPMQGAVYSEDDLKEEEAYCAIDLYASDVAICPKTWSTSPGMTVYDISEGPYANDRRGFERNACAEGKSAKDLAADDLAKFKPTVNARGTSGTFSTSSLLYYHVSRYFGAEVGVPVAVWRSMDRATHLSEVARPGLALSGHSHSSGMNHAGWRVLVDADENPDSYSPTSDLFTADRASLYGVFLKSPGSRYGSEVNGTRKSGWGKGQNLDFQETAPFLALRSPKPLAGAIAEGVAQAVRDPQIRRDMGADVDPRQVAYWMRDIANIVLLDYIFSQQDRIGNIDYRLYWMWVEDGAVKHKRAEHHHKSEPAPNPEAIRVKRTRLNDNDAGGRVQYANFAKTTQMLEKLRHFPATTYRKLMALHADLQSSGPLHAYLRDSFGLSDRELAQIVNNTALAAGILSERCARGDLAFDLEPDEFFLAGDVTPRVIDCAGR
jgi:hypothetical protein